MDDLDYIPIAALNHYAYCPHRCWRMFVAGEFVDNSYTVEGTDLHKRVHTVGESNRQDTWQIRAIWLKSEQYQLIGKADLIESHDGEIFPVEYKRGTKAKWDNDELQLCAQAFCLEEMTGKSINKGFIYYGSSHQRKEVAIDHTLRQQAIATLQALQTLFQMGVMPLAVYSPRCQGCSLYDRCLPRLAQKVRQYQEEI